MQLPEKMAIRRAKLSMQSIVHAGKPAYGATPKNKGESHGE